MIVASAVADVYMAIVICSCIDFRSVTSIDIEQNRTVKPAHRKLLIRNTFFITVPSTTESALNCPRARQASGSLPPQALITIDNALV